jgi:hypothetical protein
MTHISMTALGCGRRLSTHVRLGRRGFWGRAASIAVLAALGAATIGAAPSVQLERLDGGPVDPFALAADVKVALFVFVSVDCPVSNRYAPEIRRLHDAFAAQGVAIRLVYPNPAESAAAIRDHLKAYGYPVEGLRDPHHLLVKQAGISITPEAAAFTPDGRLIYRGRIDDRYVSLGVERPAATRRDLFEALTDTLAGQPVREPRTQAVGCYVSDFAR